MRVVGCGFRIADLSITRRAELTSGCSYDRQAEPQVGHEGLPYWFFRTASITAAASTSRPPACAISGRPPPLPPKRAMSALMTADASNAVAELKFGPATELGPTDRTRVASPGGDDQARARLRDEHGRQSRARRWPVRATSGRWRRDRRPRRRWSGRQQRRRARIARPRRRRATRQAHGLAGEPPSRRPAGA